MEGLKNQEYGANDVNLLPVKLLVSSKNLYYCGKISELKSVPFKYPKPAKIVNQNLCEPIAKYCASAAQCNLFNNADQTKHILYRRLFVTFATTPATT